MVAQGGGLPRDLLSRLGGASSSSMVILRYKFYSLPSSTSHSTSVSQCISCVNTTSVWCFKAHQPEKTMTKSCMWKMQRRQQNHFKLYFARLGRANNKLIVDVRLCVYAVSAQFETLGKIGHPSWKSPFQAFLISVDKVLASCRAQVVSFAHWCFQVCWSIFRQWMLLHECNEYHFIYTLGI